MKWMPEELFVFLLVLVATGASRMKPSGHVGSKRTEDRGDRLVRFDHFDDYLLSIASPSSFNQVLKEEDATVGPEGPVSTLPTTPAPELHPLDILNYFKDVPREHWSCCMLGKLAGDKGFHCLADFYASRVSARNFNRAHNRRMSFHTQDHITASSRAIMRTFQRCVARHASDFHKCCYAGTVERREMSRWQRFRDRAERSNIRVELEN